MKTWIPWEEIEAEWMKEPGFAEGLEQAQREFDAEIEKYGTIANPKPTPHTPRARALFPYRKNRVRAKEKPAFALQRKRVVA